MTLKTRAEIQRLIQIRDEVLDTNHNAEVSEAELMGNYASVADELESFGIETVKDLRYWTSYYRPNTEVKKGLDGEYAPVERSDSLRFQAVSAYENNELMDAALQIEGNQDAANDQATSQLVRWEDDWRKFYDQHVDMTQNEIRRQFVQQIEDGAWGSFWYDGLTPEACAAAFNAADLKAIKNSLILQIFYTEKKISYEKDQNRFHELLTESEPHQGNCNVLATLALHLLKVVDDDSIAPLLIPEHVTLCVNTSQGSIYLDPAADLGFRTPNYYEKRGARDPIRRNLEAPVEPWEILTATYTDSALVKSKNNDFEGSIKDLNSALEICPENMFAHMNLGVNYEAMGDRQAAMEHYRKAIDISPTYKPALEAYNKLVLQPPE